MAISPSRTADSDPSAGPDPALGAREFRTALARIPASMVVATAMNGDRPVGMIVGTFSSASLDPPLVGFLAARTSATLPRLLAAERLCFNLLREDGLSIVDAFRRPAGERFAGVDWRVDPDYGTPVIRPSVLTVHAEPHSVSAAGDHQFVLCRVLHHAVAGLARPLVVCAGRLNRMDPGQLVDEHAWQLGAAE